MYWSPSAMVLTHTHLSRDLFDGCHLEKQEWKNVLTTQMSTAERNQNYFHSGWSALERVPERLTNNYFAIPTTICLYLHEALGLFPIDRYL